MSQKTKSKSLYFTHNNGGLSFMIEVNSKLIRVFKMSADNKTPNSEIRKNPKLYFDNEVQDIKNYKKFFSSEKPSWAGKYISHEPGNSVIVDLGDNNYIYIGSIIKSFKTHDKILKYYSPIGNSGVAYPYAVGEENTYLLIEDVYLPNNEVAKDPYQTYYALDNGEKKSYQKKYKLKHKILVK
jgi:hypothetical protein